MTGQTTAHCARKRTTLEAVFHATVTGLALVATLAPVASAQQRGTVAFVGANVIPMDRERVIENQTVIVRDGRISVVGPVASTAVPEGATRVNALGKFLIPGIAEMHGHVPAVGAQGAQFAEDVLFLYVAAGATTVRGMQGHATQLELRRRIESGEIVGPRLVLAGPALSGNSAADAATAERLVRQQKSQGFDMLKVHEGLSLEAYDAIARTAGELDMQWGGHVSDVVGLEHALEKRQTTIDHVDNYVIDMSREPGAGVTPANIDRSRIALLAKATKDAGVAVVPTMALWEVILGMHPVVGMMSRPELRYMPPATVRTWANNTSARTAQVDPAQSKLEAELRIEMLRALHDAGVPILMGTDAPQLFSVPGFSLERELPVMARAGMTPFEILQTGTTGVAAHFGWNDTGTIAAGKRADLILLDANPLQDIANIGRRAGVMVNGRWLPWSEIQARLDTMAARNGAG